MSKSKSKGTAAETAIADFMNGWFRDVAVDHSLEPIEGTGYILNHPDAESVRYPLQMTDAQRKAHPDPARILNYLYERGAILLDPNAGRRDFDKEGWPFTRIPSLGSNDGGDVHGPFTAIEVKNYSDPPVSDLLANAEWKGQNAKKPYWLLAYKAAGKGTRTVHSWHGMVTAEHAMQAYELIDESGNPFVYDEDAIRYACADGLVMPPMQIGGLVPGATRVAFPWSIVFVFTNRVNGIQAIRDQKFSEHFSWHDRTIPIIISPRRQVDGVGGYAPAGKWYAYSKMRGYARILETLGILPQDASEYVEA